MFMFLFPLENTIYIDDFFHNSICYRVGPKYFLKLTLLFPKIFEVFLCLLGFFQVLFNSYEGLD